MPRGVLSSDKQRNNVAPAADAASGLTPGEAAALAHPSRRAVAEALVPSGGLTVAELARRVDLHPNAVRQHLEVLQRAGVVVRRRRRPPAGAGGPARATRWRLRTRWRRWGTASWFVCCWSSSAAAARARTSRGLRLGAGARSGRRRAGGGRPGRIDGGSGIRPGGGHKRGRPASGQVDLRLRACPFKDAVLAEGGHLDLCVAPRARPRRARAHRRLGGARGLRAEAPGDRRLPGTGHGPRHGRPSRGTTVVPDGRVSSTTALRDGFGRVHRSLRVSVTDRCNIRCRYCMPAEGMKWRRARRLLDDDELVRRAASPARA